MESNKEITTDEDFTTIVNEIKRNTSELYNSWLEDINNIIKNFDEKKFKEIRFQLITQEINMVQRLSDPNLENELKRLENELIHLRRTMENLSD